MHVFIFLRTFYGKVALAHDDIGDCVGEEEEEEADRDVLQKPVEHWAREGERRSVAMLCQQPDPDETTDSGENQQDLDSHQ